MPLPDEPPNPRPGARAGAAELLSSKARFVIAHRGCSRLAPENTLPAFELGLHTRAQLIEFDARRSRDGHLLTIHDAELDRTTDAVRRWRRRHNRVEAHDAEAIRALDAGGWFDSRFAGIKIPLLSEALQVLEPAAALALVERKSGDAADYLHLFWRMGCVPRVMLQSFDWRFLREVHQLAPELVLGALGPAGVLPSGRKPLGVSRRLNAPWLKQVHATGARAVVWNRQVSKRAIRLAHDQGLKVWVYTIDDPRLARRLFAAGVDGMITNDPSRITPPWPP